MNKTKLFLPKSRQRALYPILSVICGSLILLALLRGLQNPLAYAAPTATIRYVDGSSGSDSSDCSVSATPCATIQYAINQSLSGDEIRVAQGTYTETVGIGITLILKGGYEAAGWTRNIAANPAIIDANGANTSVVNITPGINVVIEGFTIQGANNAGDNGGGFLINNATVVISATVVQNNATSGGGGGGVWYEGSNVNVSVVNSSLLNNSASASGGGIAGCCTGSNSALSLDNVTVRENSAPSGGGLALNDVAATITNSQIVSNTAASGDGGGINAGPNVTLSLANSAVLSNTALGGGGLSLNNSAVSLDNVNLTGNQASGSGGGVALSQATAVITNSQIANNTAGWSGGGLALDNNASVTLTSVTVQGNQAVSSGYAAGGGVDTRNSSLTLNDSVIENNEVRSTGGGETLGGAINNNFGSVEITNSIIRNNNSQGTPVVQIYQAVLTVTNTLVNDNLGPGFAGTPTQGSFTNVTIANNGGFGLGIGPLGTGDPPVNVSIVNSVFWGNGGVDYYCDSSVGQVNCTLAYSNVGVGNTSGTGNLSLDPLFVDAAGADYHLQEGSPVVNRGTPYNAPPADLAGAPRDMLPDMGVYELSRVDNDLAVMAALPESPVIQGQQTAVQATVLNAGNLPQAQFTVACRITEMAGGTEVYSDTAVLTPPGGLPPMQATAVSLNPVTLSNAGAHQLTCQQTLAGEQRPQNDTLTQTINVINDTPDVFVRDNFADNGDVPTDPDDWYGSPDIWVRHADDGGLEHQDPIAGQTNYVYARIHNRGTQPQDGTVNLTWIEPSLGTRCGDWAPIGTITYTDLQPGETRILSIPWVPSRSGHTCLQALLDSTPDPFNRSLECTPLWVPWDNNLGWRNVNIFDNDAGPNDILATAVNTTTADLTNVYNLPADVDLIVDRLTFPQSGEMIVELPQNLFDAWQANGGQGTGIEPVAGTNQIRITAAVSGTVAGIPMEAAQRETLALQFTGPTGLEFEVRLRERINGLVVGGIEYQWRIPDTTPPGVISVTPANRAAGISPAAAFTVTFDEPVAPSSFNFTLTPAPAGTFTLTWNADNTAVVVTHDGLASGTSYTASVSAADGALNGMPAAYQWTFATAPYRIFLPVISR